MMSSLLKGNPSQSFKDITDDYYQELRKPKQILFFVNGNPNFICKVLSITPNRYFILNDLLDDLTKCFIKYIPTGVRRIYSKSAQQIVDIDDFQHRNFYICCGQESLKFCDYESKYYELIQKGHLHNHNSQIKFFYSPQEYLDNGDSFRSLQTPLFYRGNRLYPINDTPQTANSSRLIPRSPSHQDDRISKASPSTNSERNQKPKIFTIIRNGEKPLLFFKILLNKNSTQSYEELLSDITDAFGSQSTGKPIHKIYAIDGKEIQEMSEFFQSGNYFVAIGNKEPNLKTDDIKKIIKEVFPDYDKLSIPDTNENKSSNIGNSKPNDKQKEKEMSLKDDELPHDHTKKSYRKSDFPSSVSDNNSRKYQNNQTPSTNDRDINKFPKKKKEYIKQSIPVMDKMENQFQGYPINDSRKPGPFEMPIEENNEETLSPKLRAQIFNLERIRAGLEERERARQIMAKKLEQENFTSKYPSNNSKILNNFRKEDNNFRGKNFNKKIPHNLKLSPYLESLNGPWFDKENIGPSRNRKGQINKNLKNNFPYPYLRNTLNENPPYIKKRPTQKNMQSNPYKNLKSKMNKNQGNLDKINQPWERIPPINFGRFTPRNETQEKSYPMPEIKISLPIVKENNDYNKTISNPPVSKEIQASRKYNISFEVNLLDETVDSSQSSNVNENPLSGKRNESGNHKIKENPNVNNNERNKPNNLIPESSSKSKTKHLNWNDFLSNKSNIEKKKSLAVIVGPRSETVNLSKASKSFQKPTRTKKQSSVIQNPMSQRIVPLLAEQLTNNDDLEKYYHLGTVLGSGNFSEVKEAKKIGTGKPFAAKVINKTKLKDKEELIEEEIRILKSCNHPNIIHLEEQFETPDNVFLIQELIRGGDLFDAICEFIKFPESQAAVMMRDLFRALLYIHSRGIVHRDIKPENLLCTRKNDVINLKLTDFGLAVEVKEPLYVICGTPTYVAPEILKEKGYGIEVDIWAAGVICYILLSGFPPFRSPERNQTELFEFIKAGEFEFLKPYWDNISEDSKDLITKMLIVDPEKRFTVLDCLCHPWIISLGNSIKFTKSINEVVTEARVDLQIEAAIFKENYKNNNKNNNLPTIDNVNL